MISRLEVLVGRAVERWVDTTRRVAVAIVAVTIVATTAVLVYVSRELGVHGGTEDMLSQELPFQRDWNDFRVAFPQLFDPFYVVVEADTAARAREAAELLAERLSSDADRFEYVYLPGHGSFFERHGLLYLSPDELNDLADHLAEVQPYLAELGRDPTLRGLFDLLTTGLDAAREGEFTVLDLAPVLDRIADAVDAALEDRPEAFSWDTVILGDAPTGGTFRVLIVTPYFDYSDLQPARAGMLRLRGAIEELGFDGGGDVRARITGDSALEYEELEIVSRDAATAGFISFVLVSVLLLVALRRPWMVLSTLITLVVGLLLTAGFATLAIGHLNPISVAFAVLFIGLSVDFAIHVCLRYRELVVLGEPHAQALRGTARGVGSSLVLCSVSTAIGFYAFVPTDFLGVAELGLIAGTGMLISLACNLTLLPALLSLRPLRAVSARPQRARHWSALLELPARRAAWVTGAALALGIGSLALLPRVYFDYNPLHLRVQDADSVTAYYDLLAHSDESPWAMTVLAPDARAADAVAGRLETLETVERTVTLSDYVPDQQDEKLAILADIALFLGPIGSAVQPAARPTLAEQTRSLRAFERAALRLEDGGAEPTLRESAGRLRHSVARVRERLASGALGAGEIATLESNLLGELPDGLRRLETALAAAHVGVDDLPDGILATTVSEDGRVRVQVHPQEDLNDNAALARFVDSVQSVTPSATGLSVVVLESARAVVRSFQQALISALAVIALLLLLLWRRVSDAALVMAPLLLAAVLTAAASVLLGISLNFADVIVLPLLLGIGVDSGIHLVHRNRTAPPTGGGLLATSTARAVLFSALTTMASFGSLAVSVHPGMASMGELLTVGIALMLACNLIFLPALVELAAPRARAPQAPNPNPS